MQSFSFNLNSSIVSLDIPLGIDIDTVTILALVPELKTLDNEQVIAKLTMLGCVNITVE